MGMLSKFYAAIIGLMTVFFPVIYLFGRKAGKDEVTAEKLNNDLAISGEMADFYKALSDEDTTDPVSPGTLIERLRSNGL